MRSRRLPNAALTAAILLWLPLAAANAQDTDSYLLLATTKTGTMQQEINDAAERGYRVVAASRTEGSQEIVVLKRTPETYRYRVLATRRTGTLEKEMNEAAEAGYRAVPGAIGTKRTVGGVIQRNSREQSGANTEGELFVVMEKGPDVPPGVSYKVLATRLTGTLQREMSETAERGYTLIALVSRTEHLAIFERTDSRQ